MYKVLNDKDIHYVIKGDFNKKLIHLWITYLTLNCTLQNEDLIKQNIHIH